MFGMIKTAFFTGLTILSSVNPLSAVPLNTTKLSANQFKCASMTNQKC